MSEDTNEYYDLAWKEIPPAFYKRFQLEEEPEIIHVVETGFKGKYLVIYEDAYELSLGKTQFLSKDEIENTFKIKL